MKSGIRPAIAAKAGAISVLALLLSSFVMPSAAAAAKPRSRSSSLYWGATIGAQLTGTQAPFDMTAVSKFERKEGKGLSLVGFASPFANCASSPCSFYKFPTAAMENVREHGAIPFFSWASQQTPLSLDEPDFQLADVTNGTYDPYIRDFATAAKAWGHPFFLRFNFEANGNWFPWSEQTNGNGPGQYVAAWRHVHDIFTSVGATNATWAWCPNVNISHNLQSLRSLYPGDRYVDWTCLDGFNWGARSDSPGWLSFGQVFRSTYRQIARKIAPAKPMIIGETASNDRGGSKAAWIRDMLARLAAGYPKIHGVLWFDVIDRNTHWPIETSRSVTRAFRKGIRRRVYTRNIYADLSASPIPPPR